MIEKLERHIREEDGVKISCPPDNEYIIHKINEIIEALNPILEERESGIKVYEEAQNMFDTAILDGIKDKKVDVTILPKDPCVELKCPVCGKQMKIGTLDQDDSMGTVWMSIMPCDCVCSYGASKAVWQELIRTRKALEIAVDALKDCEKILKADRKDWGYLTAKIALNQIEALAEITALEQKD